MSGLSGTQTRRPLGTNEVAAQASCPMTLNSRNGLLRQGAADTTSIGLSQAFTSHAFVLGPGVGNDTRCRWFFSGQTVLLRSAERGGKPAVGVALSPA